MGVCCFHPDAAVGRQPFGIGKRDTRYACTVPTGVDADQKLSLMVVIVELLIKLLHNLDGFGPIEKGIHHLIASGKVPVKIQ